MPTEVFFVYYRQTLDLRQMAAMAWDIIWQLTLLNPSSEHTQQVNIYISTLKLTKQQYWYTRKKLPQGQIFISTKDHNSDFIDEHSVIREELMVKSTVFSSASKPQWLLLSVELMIHTRLNQVYLYQLVLYLQWSRSIVKMCLITWRKRSSGPAFSSPIIFTETASTQEHRISSQSVPSRMKRVGEFSAHVLFHYCKVNCWATSLFSSVKVLSLFHAGLKSLVVQGVKNPLVDLLSLEDKTLDEVRFSEMMSQLSNLSLV